MLWLVLAIFVYSILSSSLATTYVRFDSLKQMKYRTFLCSSLIGLAFLCILIYLYEFDTQTEGIVFLVLAQFGILVTLFNIGAISDLDFEEDSQAWDFDELD